MIDFNNPLYRHVGDYDESEHLVSCLLIALSDLKVIRGRTADEAFNLLQQIHCEIEERVYG